MMTNPLEPFGVKVKRTDSGTAYVLTWGRWGSPTFTTICASEARAWRYAWCLAFGAPEPTDAPREYNREPATL